MGELTLRVPEWLLKVIDKGLQDLPYREAAPAIAEINRQIADSKKTETNSAPAAS